MFCDAPPRNTNASAPTKNGPHIHYHYVPRASTSNARYSGRSQKCGSAEHEKGSSMVGECTARTRGLGMGMGNARHIYAMKHHIVDPNNNTYNQVNFIESPPTQTSGKGTGIPVTITYQNVAYVPRPKNMLRISQKSCHEV